MKKLFKYLPLAIVLIIIIAVVASVWSSYNGTVALRETVNSRESEVKNRLQQRHDKMTQIISAVQGLQDHAEDIHQMITEARAAYASAKSQSELVEADQLETQALARLLIVVEQNPDITASQAYYAYIDEVSAMENTLAVSRRDYNQAVQKYNTEVKKFPKVLYLGIFGFEKQLPYWEIDEDAGEVPLGDFSD